jgi:DME family drug/metabolite transporter
MRSGAVLVMAAAVLWGTTGTAQALSRYAGSPVGLGAARLAGAGLVLGLVAVVVHRAAAWRFPAGTRRWLVLGATAMAGYQISFFTATKATGVAVGTLTAIGSAPLVAGVIAAATGTRPTRRWLGATAVALAGLALLVAPGGGARIDVGGVAAGLAAGVSYAVYTWCSRRLLDAGTSPLPLLAGLFLGGALLILPFGWRGTAQWFTDPAGLTVVTYLTVVATVLPYLIWITGMRTTPPAVATTLTLTEPLTAALLGVLVLGEPLTLTLAGGAVLLAIGLVLASGGRLEQGGDLGVGEPAGPAGPEVTEPDRPDRGAYQP